MFAACGSSDKTTLPKEELNTLDGMLQNVKSFDSKKTKDIDSLKNRLRSEDNSFLEEWGLNMALGRQYLAFCSDSSAQYFSTARKLAVENQNDSLAVLSRILQVNAWAASGIFTPAITTLQELDSANLSPSLRLELNKAGRQVYSYLRSYAKGYDELTPQFNAEYDRYENYVLNNMPENDPFRRFLLAQHHANNGETVRAQKELAELIPTLPQDSNVYGMATFQMSNVYRDLGNDYERGRYLALAAISDVRGSVKETLALPALAQWLYDKGEDKRAYRYINAVLEDAMHSNARMRLNDIASLLPMIDNSYRKRMASSRDELMIYLILVAVLLIVAGVLLSVVHRTSGKTKQANMKLAAQTKLQESYIGHFLGLCSSYSDKLESMRRLVSRKIASGQTDELLKTLKSGKFTDPENDDFFKIFDETFLELYPNFLDSFNALLRPDCQISHKRGTPLSTELRIYAFVRLGVEESVRIAKILHCSVSTIYTYRNRMRGRAIDRDKFEEQVLNL